MESTRTNARGPRPASGLIAPCNSTCLSLPDPRTKPTPVLLVPAEDRTAGTRRNFSPVALLCRSERFSDAMKMSRRLAGASEASAPATLSRSRDHFQWKPIRRPSHFPERSTRRNSFTRTRPSVSPERSQFDSDAVSPNEANTRFHLFPRSPPWECRLGRSASAFVPGQDDAERRRLPSTAASSIGADLRTRPVGGSAVRPIRRKPRQLGELRFSGPASFQSAPPLRSGICQARPIFVNWPGRYVTA